MSTTNDFQEKLAKRREALAKAEQKGAIIVREKEDKKKSKVKSTPITELRENREIVMPGVGNRPKTISVTANIPKTVAQVTQKNNEESFIRNSFKYILENDYTHFPGAAMVFQYETKLPKDQWNTLSDSKKQYYVLRDLGAQQKAPLSRPSFIDKLLGFSQDMQRDFMEKYLKQPLDYWKFMNEWMNSPDVLQKLASNIIDEELEFDERKISNTEAVSVIEKKIKDEIKKTAFDYAIKHNIPEEEITGLNYYSILQKISQALGKSENYYGKKFTKKYILQAKELNIKNASHLKLGDLAYKIALKLAPKNVTENIDFIGYKDAAAYQKLIEKFKSVRYQELERGVNKAARRYANKNGIVLTDREAQNNPYYTVLLRAQNKSEAQLTDIPGIPDSGDNDGDNDGNLVAAPPSSASMASNIILKKYMDLAREYGLINPEKLSMKKLLDFIVDMEVLNIKQEYTSEQLTGIITEMLATYLATLTQGNVEDFKDLDINQLENEISKYIHVTQDKVKNYCVSTLLKFGWISNRVKDVWVSNMLLGDEENYIITNFSENKFYKANDNFYFLQCGNYSYMREQIGYALICYDNMHKLIKTMVAYTVVYPPSKNKYRVISRSAPDYVPNYVRVNTPVIIQDESLFNAEVKFIQQERVKRINNIYDILSKSVDENSIYTAMTFLSIALKSVAPMAEVYNMSNSKNAYVYKAIQSVIKLYITNRELFRKVADVMAYIYLDIAKLFHKRIEAGYYLPEVLMSLSYDDKIDGIITIQKEGKQESYFDETLAISINNEINRLVNDMAEYLRKISDPTAKRQTAPDINVPKNIGDNLVDYTRLCVNKNDAQDIPKDKLIIYRDKSGKSYCLNVDELAERFDVGDFKNPYTNTLFSDDFINRYTVEYSEIPEDTEILYVPSKAGGGGGGDDATVYKFRFKNIYDQLKSGDYINHLSPLDKKFDDVFIRSVLAKVKRFPKWNLLQRFKAGNLINMDTGKLFREEFVDKLLAQDNMKNTQEKIKAEIIAATKNNDKNKVRLLTEKYNNNRRSIIMGDFIKDDLLLAQCANPQDIKGVALQDIIFYKDGGGVYCFEKNFFRERAAQGKVNKYTGNKLNNNFPNFLDTYIEGKKPNIFEGPVEDLIIVSENDGDITGIDNINNLPKSLQPKPELLVMPSDIVISNLWQIVEQKLIDDGLMPVAMIEDIKNRDKEIEDYKHKNNNPPQVSDSDIKMEEAVSKANIEETVNEALAEALSDQVEQQEEEEEESQEEEEEEDSTSSSESISTTTSSSSSSSPSSSEAENKNNKNNNNNKNEKPADKSPEDESPPVIVGFDKNSKEDMNKINCEHCKKSAVDGFSSIILENKDSPTIVAFCTTHCMEKFKFPKYKKK